MKNLLVTLMIAFVLFTSSPAEALRASVIKKILDKVVDLLKGKPTVKKKSGDEGGNIYNLGEEGAGIIYDLDEDGARKRLESNRDEEKNGREGPRRFTLKENRDRGERGTRKEATFKGAGVPFWNGDKHVLFPRERSAREAVKCEDSNQKMVAGFGASVYERPDLESSFLGKYEPNERVCVKSQTLGWRLTPFGWLEEKSIF